MKRARFLGKFNKMRKGNRGNFGEVGSTSSDSDRANCRKATEDYILKYAEEYIKEHGKPPSRPPHLKGRQIGMWYCAIKKLKDRFTDSNMEVKNNIRVVADVELTSSQRNEIATVLNNLQDKMNSVSHSENSNENIKISQFEKKFLENITGKLEDNIDGYMQYEQDIQIDEILYNESLKKIENINYTNMLKKRKLLPSFRVKDKIIDLIKSSRVSLISGETGCGKTTQVPQFLLDHFIDNKKGSLCKIVCTQPRRISAISVAERVATERAEKLGYSTGYQIRLEKLLPRDRGSLTFCTTGVVLRQMQSDPCLSEYTHIIIDEIHERDITTDFLLTLLKQVINQREDLRVILMSATLNADSFSKYFQNCPHINIPGFTYHVEEYFLEDAIHRTGFQFEVKNRFRQRDFDSNAELTGVIEPYIKELRAENKFNAEVFKQLRNPNSEVLNLRLVFELLVDICYTEKEQGAVLIFVPGFSDISDLHKAIKTSGKFPRSNFLVIPLHSQMPTVEQRQVFETPPMGVRKIVIATNIAETSITIDDAVFVIDCGKIKVKFYDITTNTETLECRWVAKANAAQRKGRAGRVKPGVCYHLISKPRYRALEPYILPEILRVRLENVILTAKILQLGKVEEFFSCLMDSPDPNIVSTSLELLKRLEALDENESLTPLGYHLAKLPMNPQIGKMLLFGALFNCLEPILNIAVSLDYRDPFLIPLGKEREAEKKRRDFVGLCQSDHIFMDTWIDTFEKLEDYKRKKFCWEYFLSFPTMNQLVKLKRDFMENLYEMSFVPNKNPKCEECNSNSDKIDLVRAVVCAGLYPNIVRVKVRGKKKITSTLRLLNGKSVSFHPKSILNGQYIGSPLLVYFKMVKSSSVFIHDATPVDPFHVIFFGDNFQQVSDGEFNFITISNCLRFSSGKITSDIIRELRQKLNQLLEYKVSHPSVVDLRKNNEETHLFRKIIELLQNDGVDQCELDPFQEEEEVT